MKKIFLLSTFFFLFLQLQAQVGALDPSFGTGGFVRLGVNYNATAFQSNGKLIGVQMITGGFTVTRYTTNGSLDVSFGTGGTVTTLIPYLTTPTNVLVAIQSNDNIVVQVDGGSSFGSNTYSSYKTTALARFNSNGVLDTTFGSGGLVSQNIGLYGYFGFTIAFLTVRNNGEIVTGINSYQYKRSFAGISYYNSDGTYRSGSSLNYAQFTEIHSLAMANDGRIVVGVLIADRSNYNYTRRRLIALDGSWEAEYNGAVLAIQTDGKILAASGGELTRFNLNGSSDTAFGNIYGRVNTGIAINKAIIQSDGKIIVAGTLDSNFAIARYNANGTIDYTFGRGGITTTDFGGTESVANMAIAGNRLYAYGNEILAAYSLVPNTITCTPPAFINNDQMVTDAHCGNSDGSIRIVPQVALHLLCTL